MEYQKDDTISLGVCKVFLSRLSAPQPEAGSYFSPYVPSSAYFPGCQSFPSKAPPKVPSCFLTGCFLEGGDVAGRSIKELWFPFRVTEMNFMTLLQITAPDNELNLSSKEKKTFIFFYCINNGKLDSFLYRLYIYRQVWLEKNIW